MLIKYLWRSLWRDGRERNMFKSIQWLEGDLWIYGSCFRDASTCPKTLVPTPNGQAPPLWGWPLAIGCAGVKGHQFQRNMYHGPEAYDNDHALRGNSIMGIHTPYWIWSQWATRSFPTTWKTAMFVGHGLQSWSKSFSQLEKKWF